MYIFYMLKKFNSVYQKSNNQKDITKAHLLNSTHNMMIYN